MNTTGVLCISGFLWRALRLKSPYHGEAWLVSQDCVAHSSKIQFIFLSCYLNEPDSIHFLWYLHTLLFLGAVILFLSEQGYAYLGVAGWRLVKWDIMLHFITLMERNTIWRLILEKTTSYSTLKMFGECAQLSSGPINRLIGIWNLVEFGSIRFLTLFDALTAYLINFWKHFSTKLCKPFCLKI